MQFIQTEENRANNNTLSNLNYANIKHKLENKLIELDLPGNLKNKLFDKKRDYGHATYKIIGGHNEWRSTQNAEKIYICVKTDGTFDLLHNTIKYKENGLPVGTICISAIRLGGFTGKAQRPSLPRLIEENTPLKYRPGRNNA